MTPTGQGDKKIMKNNNELNKKEMNRRELSMDEAEQVNGGILPFLIVGAMVAGTVTLFGVTTASNLSKND